MTLASDARVHHDNDSDPLFDGTKLEQHLIICRAERIVFHERYESATIRLSAVITLLTGADIFANDVDAVRAARINEIHQAHVAHWSSAPDEVVNAIAKECRAWGIQIYVSDLPAASAAPQQLFSIVTEYAPGQMVAEHHLTRESRVESLVNRAEQFFEESGRIPEIILGDEQRLASLVSTFLMPARVSLIESELDAAQVHYRPAGRLMHVR